MTRFEFTKGLRQALSGRASHTVVNENVAYYEKYIDTELGKGRTEEEILNELGDPRLIAKTILETAGKEEKDRAGGEERERYASGGRVFRLPMWLALLLVLLICILLLQLAGYIVSLLLPVALPVLALILAVHYFRRR